MSTPSVDQVVAETRAIAGLVGLPAPGGDLDRLRPLIAHYAEIVVSPRAVELVVGGPPDRLAQAAHEAGIGAQALAAFADCVRTFRPTHVGLKLAWGAGRASLYARLLAPLADGLEFLARLVPTGGLARACAGRRILYGLGFCGDPLTIKTYAIAKRGFVSWRLDATGLLPESKDYRAKRPLRDEGGAWGTVVVGLKGMGFTVADHAAMRQSPGAPSEPKLYFERIAPIPTDWSAR